MRRSHRAFTTLLGIACLTVPTGAAAQRDASRCEESLDSPHGRNEKVCAEERARRTFRLFGVGDNAVAGLRTAAPDITFAASNSDIGDQSQLTNPIPIYLKGLPNIGNRNSARFFEIHYWATAAPGDFFKARDTTGIESLQNVRGGGYTFMSNTAAGGAGDFHSARDGTLGVLFAGEKSATGSCLDQGPSFLPAGRALLAMSDCELTWPEINGAKVWRGSPHFNQDGWLAYQSAVGRGNFTFDFWRVPATYADPDRRFIGTATQTYGITSDHGRETRERFGAVIPGGRGDPQFDGYPLGLDWHFDANTFNVSTVGRLMVVQVRIVNNSADVYGQGIDYDSLYVGLSTRWLQGDEAGNGRRANVHTLPQYGAVVANELGRLVGCNGALVPSYIISAGCGAGGLPARNTAGFKVGASGVMYFKSPIGDLRNKLLSNPTSPFFTPGHPHSGDTITYNRMSLCGFDCSNVMFNDKNMQRSFGVISAREPQSVFGRPAPANWTDYDWWHLFKPASGLGTRVDLARPRAGGGYNFCVVPGWSYTNRPAKAPASTGDTLFYDNCNPNTNTYTGLWADTLPDRSINWAFNNTWSGAGPFPLKAGDTTGFVFGIIAAPDSAQFMQLLRDAYDFYLDFYLGPGVPVAPTVRAATVLGGPRVTDQWRARITLDYTNTLRPDASIPNTVQKLRSAAPTSDEGIALALNPWLADSIAIRSVGLIDTIYVYKSCNGGRTFTATKSRGICRTDRAVDAHGRPVGTGWQAYATLTRDANGNFPATYEDPNIQGGQRYLYSFVAHRPSLVFTVLDSGNVPVPVGSPPMRGLVLRQDTVLKASYSALKTTPGDPSVAEIYVPVSEQAGATGPEVETSVVGPTPLTYHGATVTPVGRFAEPLRYTVFFGDTLLVEERTADTRTARDSITLRLIRTVPVGFPSAGSNVQRRVPRDTMIFAAGHLVPVSYGATPLYDSTYRLEVGELDAVIVRKRKFASFGAVVANSVPDAAGVREPFFASSTLTGSAFTPPAAAGVVDAPPLTFSVTNRNGTLFERFWSQPGFTRLRAIGTPTFTFISDTLFTATGAGYGEYRVAFRDTEYGPGQPFTLDFANPARTDSAVRASLLQRARADSTRTDTETLDIINRSLGTSYTQADLVKLYVPFTIENAVLDSAGDNNVVRLAALRSSVTLAGGAPKRLLLGSGADTLSVAYPTADSVWVPGTPLIFIENVPIVDTLDTPGAIPRSENDRIVFASQPRVTFSQATLGCGGRGGVRCNAVSGRGSSDYVSVRAQQTLHVRFYNPFNAVTEVAFTLQPPVEGLAARATKGDLERVKVVPNPYVVLSAYEQGADIKRIMFTHVPAEGVIRIYTAAGTFVQQLTWTPEMLNGTGDLFWDMRSREGFDVAPGLYLFTVEATGRAGGAKRRTPGRFIIIR